MASNLVATNLAKGVRTTVVMTATKKMTPHSNQFIIAFHSFARRVAARVTNIIIIAFKIDLE